MFGNLVKAIAQDRGGNENLGRGPGQIPIKDCSTTKSMKNRALSRCTISTKTGLFNISVAITPVAESLFDLIT